MQLLGSKVLISHNSFKVITCSKLTTFKLCSCFFQFRTISFWPIGFHSRHKKECWNFQSKTLNWIHVVNREGRNKLPNIFNVFAIVQIMRFFPKETRSIKYSVYAFVPLFFMAEKNITPCRWPSWEKYNIWTYLIQFNW